VPGLGCRVRIRFRLPGSVQSFVGFWLPGSNIRFLVLIRFRLLVLIRFRVLVLIRFLAAGLWLPGSD
jgi:hypothetical protein